MRRRKRSKLPIASILGIAAVVLASIMIYNSGLLVNLGIMKSGIPENLGLDPNDPRVMAKVDETIDRNAVKDTVNKVLNLITGKPEQGVVVVSAHDTAKGFDVAGFTFVLEDAINSQVIETLVTDSDGLATSIPVNHKKAYRIRQIDAPYPYLDSTTEVVFEMKADIMSIRMDQKPSEMVKAYERAPDGSIKVTDFKIGAPLILQKPTLPNGCEITALASLMNHYGYEVTKETLSDDYLPKAPFYRKNGQLYGADPDIAFSGNPRDPAGWFSYAPPTVLAGQKYLDAVNGTHTVIDITGSTESEIMAYVEQGIPVGIWATRDLELANYAYGWYLDGTETFFKAAINLHCMVIDGFAGDKLYVMDPLEGEMLYDRATFFESYVSLGSRAMIMEEIANEQ